MHKLELRRVQGPTQGQPCKLSFSDKLQRLGDGSVGKSTYEPGHLSWLSQNLSERPDVVVHICNASSPTVRWEVKTGGQGPVCLSMW